MEQRSDTMQQTFIKDLSSHVGEEVTVKGWLYNLRSSGKLLFPQVRDGSGLVQGVALRSNFDDETWAKLRGLGQESSLVVIGTVRADERAPGGHELDIRSIE